MLTRFMQRAYSEMEGDEGVARRIAGEVEEAERNGAKHTMEVRYVRMPDLVVKAIDNSTGEETLIKRSGSCMVMRSDDGSLCAMRRQVLSGACASPFDFMLSAFSRGRLSSSMRDAMFADYGTGKRVTYNLGIEEKRKLKEKKEEKQQQYDKLKDQLTRLRDNPNNQVVTDLGIETDAGMRDKEDELEAKLSLAKAGLDGINAMERNDPHARDKAMQDTFRANDKLDVIERNKEKLKKDAEDRNSFDGGSGMDRYKGYGGKGVGNTKSTMQVRTESYVSDMTDGDERLFATRYVSSRRFQSPTTSSSNSKFQYGATLSKNSPAAKGTQASQPQDSEQAPQNSQNSTQNDGKPLNVNDGKDASPAPQPPPYNPSKADGNGGSAQDANGSGAQSDEAPKNQPQHDYSADIKSVNDKMSGMEKQLGQLTEALKNLQTAQPPAPKPTQASQNEKQSTPPGAEQQGDESLAPSSSNTQQPQPNNPQPNRGRQIDWSKFNSNDPVNDPAFSKELNKLTGNYLNKWDEESGSFNDRGFWQMMQNKYGYQNPDVRERDQQRLEDNASLQAYRAQQMANDGQDFYGKLLEGRVNGTSDEIRSGVQDLNRETYANHARTLAQNLGEDVKYDTDANGNANYYYNQNVDPGRRLPNETDDAMLQRLRNQYGDNVQMTKGTNGKPQFSIRRELGNGPSYVSSSNPIAAKINSHELRFNRDVQNMQFKSPQQVAWDLHDKYVKPGVLPAWQRATQAWKNTAANGGGWWERLRNAYQASK